MSARAHVCIARHGDRLLDTAYPIQVIGGREQLLSSAASAALGRSTNAKRPGDECFIATVSAWTCQAIRKCVIANASAAVFTRAAL